MISKNINKFAQITVIEFALISLLFTGVFFSLSLPSEPTTNSYNSYNLDTYLVTLSRLDSVRKNTILENLSNSSQTQIWTTILDDINKTLSNYELIISNNTVSKNIITCIGANGKFFSSVFISSYNSTIFDTKTLTLGVCY